MRVTEQFVRFVLVGGVATAAHYMLLIMLVQFAGVAPVSSSMAGYLFGALVNYVLNYNLTFRSSKRHIETVPKFFTVAGVGFGLNALVMSMAVEGLRIHYLISQIAATVVVLLWNFSANKLWTFRESNRVGK